VSRTILLTGAGGDIGMTVARSLRDGCPDAVLIGADCRPDAQAKPPFERMAVLPRADHEGYWPALTELVEETDAQLLLPLSEAELAVLLERDLLQGTLGGATIITANALAVATGLDKLATNSRLRNAGIPVPECGLLGQQRPRTFPVIVKPRSGQGSKGIAKVSEVDFDDVAARREGDLWQCFLPADDEEFTCGLARFPGTPTRVISFRRRLAGGITGSGTVVDDGRLTDLGNAVAEALELRGSINMQLRMHGGQPLIFEINPRFSSTVGFRHQLGFRDVLWSIADLLGEPIEDYAPRGAGMRISRVGEEELILPPSLSCGSGASFP
jgi:carbamoyl-phosphate synthase large subunit